MLTTTVRRTLLATTIIAGSIAVTPAFAQSTTAADDVGVIVVTGSRVARPNAASPSPITTVGSEEIKETGATKIEDLANSLPQVVAGQTSGVSNGADGTATIDLRGLGASRTVVLIDGRRLMPGNIGGGAGADLNFIPSALVSSVDLLTGGASATYGADAVAGVVNFRMNRKFKGLRLDAQYGLYQHTNNGPLRSRVNPRYVAPEGNLVTGGSYDASIALGSGFSEDRGSFVAYAGYRADTAITQAEYDYSVCTVGATPNSNTGTVADFTCGGSNLAPQNARFFLTGENAALAGIGTAAGFYSLQPNNSVVAYNGTRDAYNFAPLNYYRRPSERITAGAFAEYEISPALRPYLDVMFADYQTKAQIAPSGLFGLDSVVNCDNPFLQTNLTLGRGICGAALGTAVDADVTIGKRNVDGGGRFNDIGYNQLRVVAGLKGDIGEAWLYDAYYQTGQIKVANVYRNDVSNTRILRSLQVVNVAGVPTCKSVVDGSDIACKPYDIFNAGRVSADALNYIGIPLVITGTTKETVVAGSLSGDLGKYGFRSPLSDDGVTVSVGAEYRTESLETQPDLAYINGDGAGTGSQLPIAGNYSVTDFFGEIGLPLITEKPFFHDLSIQGGYRKSNYNVLGASKQNKADTFKIAGNWSPIADFTFRASYNRAVRSPNIGELFANQDVGLFVGVDPCSGPAIGNKTNGTQSGPTTTAAQNAPNAYTAAQCARTGVSAAQFGNIQSNEGADQYNQLFGGNRNLNPEKADTFSFGVVLKPTAILSGLVLSVDYFDIKVNGAVGGIGSQVIIDTCLETNDPFFCSKINRAPASTGPANSGTLFGGPQGDRVNQGYVNNLTTNTGSLQTSGIDINGDYRTTLGANKIRMQFVGTILDKYVVQALTNGEKYNCAGSYGLTCGIPGPKLRFNTNIKFTTADDFGITGRWRHQGAVVLDSLSTDPVLNPTKATSNGNINNRIKAYNYFDVLFSLPIKDTATFRIGVNNIFDTDPPINSTAPINGNTFPGTYDHLGRSIFVNLTADF
jgi:iron complex outermembrane recepter protein